MPAPIGQIVDEVVDQSAEHHDAERVAARDDDRRLDQLFAHEAPAATRRARVRTAVSCAREVPRASARFARFVHAISSTTPTAVRMAIRRWCGRASAAARSTSSSCERTVQARAARPVSARIGRVEPLRRSAQPRASRRDIASAGLRRAHTPRTRADAPRRAGSESRLERLRARPATAVTGIHTDSGTHRSSPRNGSRDRRRRLRTADRQGVIVRPTTRGSPFSRVPPEAIPTARRRAPPRLRPATSSSRPSRGTEPHHGEVVARDGLAEDGLRHLRRCRARSGACVPAATARERGLLRAEVLEIGPRHRRVDAPAGRRDDQSACWRGMPSGIQKQRADRRVDRRATRRCPAPARRRRTA